MYSHEPHSSTPAQEGFHQEQNHGQANEPGAKLEGASVTKQPIRAADGGVAAGSHHLTPARRTDGS